MLIKRNRTPSKCIGYGLYLYFPALSFRNAAKALSFLHMAKRSHVATWKRIQKYHPKRIIIRYHQRGSFRIHSWRGDNQGGFRMHLVRGLPSSNKKNRQILALPISKERNMFAAGRFTAGLAEAHKKTSGFHRWGGHGIGKPAGFFIPNTIFIHLWRKA
jgi:putative transposase